MIFVNLVGWLILLGIGVGSVFVLRHWQFLFGVNPDLPNETSGERSYGRAQMLIIVVLLVKLALILIFAG